MFTSKVHKLKSVHLLLVAALVLFCCGPATAGPFANAPANPLIRIDENGHGLLIFPNSNPILMPFAMQADPGPGGLLSALTYDMLGPPNLVAGDVWIQEIAGGPLSDVIRFNPAGTGGPNYPASIVFYSDNEDGVDALADTGFPLAFYTNIVIVVEEGPEGQNKAFYTPLPGQPGFVNGFQVSYEFFSDGDIVPEPGTLVLFAAGFGLMALKLVCRR